MTDHKIATVGVDAPDIPPEGTSRQDRHDPLHAPAVAPTDGELLLVSVVVASIIESTRELDVADVAAWAEHARSLRERHDTITSMLDPTAWQRDARKVNATAAVAAAFLAFRRAVEANVA